MWQESILPVRRPEDKIVPNHYCNNLASAKKRTPSPSPMPLAPGLMPSSDPRLANHLADTRVHMNDPFKALYLFFNLSFSVVLITHL